MNPPDRTRDHAYGPKSPGNSPALEIAIVALAVARNALEDLAEHVEPGPCTCAAKERQSGWHCRSCELLELLRDVNGQKYTLDVFGGTLESNTRGTGLMVDRLNKYLEDNWAEWPAPERFAELLLELAGGAAVAE
jgi:hypothetical protein